jgi:hypothetical protein
MRERIAATGDADPVGQDIFIFIFTFIFIDITGASRKHHWDVRGGERRRRTAKSGPGLTGG